MDSADSIVKPSVLVIDDHDIVRFGLETLIDAAPDMRLAASASSLAEGLALIGRMQPDLVVTDMALGDSSGLDTVRAVIAAQRPRPTIVISMQDEMLYGEQVLSLGARGYLMKEHAHAHALPAIRAVIAGSTWVSPRLNAQLLNRLMQRNRAAADAASTSSQATLTVRELEVLQLLKSGSSTKGIAAALGISVRTVDIHRASIKRKLGLRSGSELVAYASAHL